MSTRIHEVARHHNSPGSPFHVVRFSHESIRHGIAIVFPEPGHVAILDASPAATRKEITIGNRGEFEADLRAAIGQAEYGDPPTALEERAVIEAVRQQLHADSGRDPTLWELVIGMMQTLSGAVVDGRFGQETRTKAQATQREQRRR